MLKLLGVVGCIAAVLPLPGVSACGDSGHSCYGPINTIEHVRHVKRMQPGALNSTNGPKGPLEWGQINFLQTTDTHGWLSGHLKEKNYGADWGDFASFSQRMKQTAAHRGVDLLLVDTGDLHDGAGLSDASKGVDGTMSMPIFSDVEYDLMTIGNHELYVAEVSYQIFDQYAKKWGDRYLTSNVKIQNPKTGKFEYIGVTHRYFTTKNGLRIMAFGVLFDFTGNSNATQVIKAQDMVKESWFNDAIHTKKPVDLFVLLGHNPVRQTDSSSTFKTVLDAVRAVHPKTPVQIFGGHTHIRDFSVYDDSCVAIESGRYCETLGWLSMSGFSKSNSGFKGPKNPHGVKNPSRPAKTGSQSPFVYSRRYLDWNRRTFVYHSVQSDAKFDSHSGLQITENITSARKELNLGETFGCAPQDWCLNCAPITDPKNIFPGVIYPAVSAIVLNKTRADKSRLILGNTGGFRFDVYKGPFTFDDNFSIAPFRDVFNYIPDVPFDKASKVLAGLNKAGTSSKRWASMPIPDDICTNPTLGYLSRRDARNPGGIVRRQATVDPGYVTKDDWGTDGDDTVHTGIPSYDLPDYWEARASFPNGTDPQTVDLIFVDFILNDILPILGNGYTPDMAMPYINKDFTLQEFLLPYAKLAWQENIDNCPS